MNATDNASTADFQILAATCPVGKKAVSGGAFTVVDTGTSSTVDRVAIHASFPQSLFNPNDSWVVHGVETAPDNHTNWHLVVSAVCVTAGP